MVNIINNQITELKSLSKLKMAGRLRYWRGTIEIPEIELHAICDEIQAEHDHAIATTLDEDEKLLDLAHHAWDIAVCAMQGMPIPASWGNAVEKGLRECGIDVDELPYVVPDVTLNDRRLTAEQVREVIERHSAGVIGNNRCFHDGAYEEITNELNATLSDESASL